MNHIKGLLNNVIQESSVNTKPLEVTELVDKTAMPVLKESDKEPVPALQSLEPIENNSDEDSSFNI